MNLSQKLHPRIWESTDAYQRNVFSGAFRTDPVERRRFVKHQLIWNKKYGKQLFARAAIAFGALGMEIGTPHHLHSLIVFFGVVAVAAFAESGRFLFMNQRTASPEELRNLLPSLDLSYEEGVYLDAMLALEAIQGLSENAKDEIATQLNDLLSAYLRIREQRDILMVSLGNSECVDKLRLEREGVLRKLESATDPVVVDALSQTMKAFDQRLASREAAAPSIARLDAQLQLLIQTLFSVQESLSTLRIAPTTVTSPSAEGIAKSISNINTQSRSIEAAVQEVMMIGRQI